MCLNLQKFLDIHMWRSTECPLTFFRKDHNGIYSNSIAFNSSAAGSNDSKFVRKTDVTVLQAIIEFRMNCAMLNDFDDSI